MTLNATDVLIIYHPLQKIKRKVTINNKKFTSISLFVHRNMSGNPHDRQDTVCTGRQFAIRFRFSAIRYALGACNHPNLLKMTLFRQVAACQSWQAPACLRFPHRNLHKILFVFSPSEFCRSRFLSDRGKTAENPDGFTRILTKDRRKHARQNHGSDYCSHPTPFLFYLFCYYILIVAFMCCVSMDNMLLLCKRQPV